MKIRLSYGTAVKMGLKKGKMLAEPTTAYIMLGEKCQSNCSFCAQRRDARKEGYLSSVLWLPYPENVLRDIKGFSRICFQTLDYPEVVNDLLDIIPILPKIPISVSIVPISLEDMRMLRDAGVETLSIALDAANKDIFDEVKGWKVGNRFTWETHWDSLEKARMVFPSVNTHLIVGLGESDEDLYNVMKELVDKGISIALFAFTPVFGGKPPDIGRYRAIQIVRYLLVKGYRNFVRFDKGKIKALYIPWKEKASIQKGLAFITSGCPGCNRPYYNERPGGIIYNYPYIPEEKLAIKSIKECEKYTDIIWI
jgi:biotin synthase-related radical SAM superfamily protein